VCADRKRSWLDWLACPWPDPGDPIDGDVGDEAGSGHTRRWELDIRPKVGVSESLEKRWGASLGDTSSAVNDEVLNESALVMAVRLERQDNPRIRPDVSDFCAFGEVPSYDLVAIQADPYDRHLRAAVGFKRDEVRQG
jgi:hypothetical protein